VHLPGRQVLELDRAGLANRMTGKTPVTLNGAGLPRRVPQYEGHYNGRRPHRSRQLRPPQPDHPVADLSRKRIKRRPVLGGLINECERAT